MLITGGAKWLARLDFLSLAALLIYIAMGYFGKAPCALNIIDAKKARAALVTLLGVLFISTFAHLLKHWGLETDGYDVAYVNQALFYPFETSKMWCVLCPNTNYLAEHLALSFYLFAPLTSLVKSDELIIILQYLLVSIPIIAAFKYGPLKERKEVWILAAILVLSHRSLRNGLVFDFREDQIAFAGFLLSCLFFYINRVSLAFLCMIIAVLSKENMALVSAFMALPIMLDKNLKLTKAKRKLIAASIILFSFTWFIASFTHVMPFFRGGAQIDSVILMRLPGLGSTPLEIIKNSILNPKQLLIFIYENIFTFQHVKYVVILLIPFSMFSYRVWPWLLPIIPGLGMNLISAVPNQRFMIFHYDFNILPFLIFSGIYGLSVTPMPQLKRNSWKYLLIGLIFAGRSPILHVRNYVQLAFDNYQHEKFLDSIDVNGIVGASMRVSGHIAHLKNLRALNFPDLKSGVSENYYEEFIQSNKSSKLKSGIRLDNFDYVILDNSKNNERVLISKYIETGKMISNDGRFYFFEVNEDHR